MVFTTPRYIGPTNSVLDGNIQTLRGIYGNSRGLDMLQRIALSPQSTPSQVRTASNVFTNNWQWSRGETLPGTVNSVNTSPTIPQSLNTQLSRSSAYTNAPSQEEIVDEAIARVQTAPPSTWENPSQSLHDVMNPATEETSTAADEAYEAIDAEAPKALEAFDLAATAAEIPALPLMAAQQAASGITELINNTIDSNRESQAQSDYTTAMQNGHGFGYQEVAQTNYNNAMSSANAQAAWAKGIGSLTSPVGAAIVQSLPSSWFGTNTPVNPLYAEYNQQSVIDSGVAQGAMIGVPQVDN